MDDFPSLLAPDFGLRPQVKSAPMIASKGTEIGVGGGGTINFGIGPSGSDTPYSYSSSNHREVDWNSNSIEGFLGGGYNDVFGVRPKSTNNQPNLSSSLFDFGDYIFQGESTKKNVSTSSSSSLPVYDNPVCDDDIFDGILGLKTKLSSSSSSSSPPKQGGSPFYDDLLGDLSKTESSILKMNLSGKDDNESSFDDLIPGFGGKSPLNDRETTEANQAQQPTVSSAKATSSTINDPFVGLVSTTTQVYASSGIFTDPLEQISKTSNSGSTKVNASSGSGGIFDDIDPLEGLGKSLPLFSSDMNDRDTDKSPQRTVPPVDIHQEPHPMSFHPPAVSSDSNKSTSANDSRHSFVNANNPSDTNSQVESQKAEANLEAAEDIWLTVSEIPLFTQPTSAPPPSMPPPRLTQFSNGVIAASLKKVNEFLSQHFTQNFQNLKGGPGSMKSPEVSSIDELEDFAMGKPRNNADEHGDVLSSDEEAELNSAVTASTAAMKEAMDRAEANFKHAKEVRERESSEKVGKNRVPGQQEKDEEIVQDAQERELREVGPHIDERASAGNGSSISMRKESFTTNIGDDLSSIVGATPTSGKFQEIDDESEDRLRARMFRNQQTQERMLKALAEMKEHDLRTQREQAERHRLAETLDVEIKRWAAGKETNLRALLSTLQYVLWPECGWQPVSLTVLITPASVKKVYMKAIQCIHPDKVQQKGAKQKYIAENVFHLLKEAWNKFNSEEFF